METVHEGQRWLRFVAATLMSTPYRAAYRAIGVVSLSLYVSANLAYWINLSLRVSPLLAINVVIISVFLVGRLWKKYSADVNSTAIRLIFTGYGYFNQFHNDFMTFPGEFESNEQHVRKGQRRRYLRTIVLFHMVQGCLEPFRSLMWLSSIAIYTFCEDVTKSFIEEVIRWKNGPDPQQHLSNAQFRRKVLIIVAKVTVVFSVLLYQHHHLHTKWYLIVTASYFVINQGYLESHTTKLLEKLQLDFFEGLEQYYVMGSYAVLSIVYSLFFMIWCLMRKKQLLMLLALYTNVYMGAREVLQSTVALAITEWATIALFEKASPRELADHDDICAVCLCHMTAARKTPCGHYFHGHCLRRCLKAKRACPMCNFLFSF